MPRNPAVTGALTAAVIAFAALSTTTRSQAPGGDDRAPGGSGGAASLESVTVTGCVVHEAAYARSTAAPAVARTTAADAEFVIVVDVDRRQAFSVTGSRERALAEYAGRRVEADGVIEPAPAAVVPPTEQAGQRDQPDPGASATPGSANAGLPAGASGVTPSGGPAHEPADALPGTIPQSVLGGSEAGARDTHAVGVPALPRLNLGSVRAAAGDCEPLPALPESSNAAVAAELTGARPAASAPAPTRRALETGPIEAIGCLVRWTPTGAALTAGPGDLALTQVTTLESRRPERISAVPGSQPSGRDSGTVPARTAGSGGGEPNAAGERAFLLETAGIDVGALRRHVGEQVAIVGMPADSEQAAATGAPALDHPVATRRSSGAANPGSRTEPTPTDELAHATAPMARLRVTGFRRIGGHCF